MNEGNVMGTKYHVKESCNKCKGKNQLTGKQYLDGGVICEAETKCEACGFEDYWSYGFFESSSEMVGNCDTYEIGV